MPAVLQDATTSVRFHKGLSPAAITTDTNGTSIDFGASDTDGPTLGVLLTGTVASGTQVAFALEESDDESTWETMQDAEIDLFTPDGLPRTLLSTRTKRYVRCAISIDGTSPSAAVSVLLAESRKLF